MSSVEATIQLIQQYFPVLTIKYTTVDNSVQVECRDYHFIIDNHTYELRSKIGGAFHVTCRTQHTRTFHKVIEEHAIRQAIHT